MLSSFVINPVVLALREKGGASEKLPLNFWTSGYSQIVCALVSLLHGDPQSSWAMLAQGS